MDETQRLLAMLTEGFPNISAMDPLAARRAVDARVRPAENISDAAAEDRQLRAHGRSLPVRVYRPARLRARAPVTVYAHGGGFLHGSIASHDGFCRLWAKRTGTVVVSVEYRLAPEHGAPAASEDLLRAARWALGEGLGGRVLFAGDSSGANAAAVASLSLATEQAPLLAGQALIYPFLDPTMSSASYASCGDRNFVTATTLATYWRHYLAAPGSAAAAPWQLNPALAENLADAGPAVVITAGLDPLADEGRAYARRLRGHGNRVTLRHYPDQFHGFATVPGYGPAAAAQEILWSDIADLLTQQGAPA